MNCPSCARTVALEHAFCPACGAPLARPGAHSTVLPPAVAPEPPAAVVRTGSHASMAVAAVAVIIALLALGGVVATLTLHQRAEIARAEMEELANRARQEEQRAQARAAGTAAPQPEAVTEPAAPDQAPPLSPEAPAPVPPPPEVTAPAEPEAPSMLQQRESGGWRYAPPESDDSGDAIVRLDNGLEHGLVVTLGPGASLPVAAHECVRLSCRAGALLLQVADESGAPVDERAVQLAQRGSYLYNPRAAWTYGVSSQTYSNQPSLLFMEEEEEPTLIEGVVFFSTSNIDYVFEEFPEDITVATFMPSGFERVRRLGLDHAGDPAAPSEVQSKSGGGARLELVALEYGALVMQPRAEHDYAPPSATLWLDNPYDDSVTLCAGGVALAAPVDPGALIELRMPPGEVHLTVLSPSGRLRDEARVLLPAERQAVWVPEGRRELVSGALGLSLRGVDLLLLPPDAVFGDPFLSIGEAGAMRQAVQADLAALDEEARATLAGEALATYEARRRRVDTALATDFELWLLRGLYAEAGGDAESAMARYDEVLSLAPEHARALHWRGLLYAASDAVHEARSDLAAAVELDPACEAELRPVLERLEAAAAEEYRQLEEERAQQEVPIEMAWGVRQEQLAAERQELEGEVSRLEALGDLVSSEELEGKRAALAAHRLTEQIETLEYEALVMEGNGDTDGAALKRAEAERLRSAAGDGEEGDE